MKTTMKTIAAVAALTASMGVMAATTVTYQAVAGAVSVDTRSTDVSGFNIRAEHELKSADSIVLSHQSLSADVFTNSGIDNEATATDISYQATLSKDASSKVTTSFGIGQADGSVGGYNLGSESYTKFNISGDLMVVDGLTLNAGYNRYFSDIDVNEFTAGADYSITRNLSVIATHEMASAEYEDVDLNRTGLGMTVKF